MSPQRLDLPVDEIVQKYRDGQSEAQIADDYGVSTEPIRKRLEEKSVSKRGDAVARNDESYEKYDDEWARLYIEEGLSTSEIGERYGTSHRTVNRRLRKEGVELRSISEAKRSDILLDEALLRELYLAENMSLKEVAEELGLTTTPVYNALVDFGIDTSYKTPAGREHPRWKGGYERRCNTRRWRKLREKRIRKDGEECVMCKMSRSEHQEEHDTDLHVHHIIPVVNFDEIEEADSLDNLITVCATCHRKWEGIPLRPQYE